MIRALSEILRESANRHRHLCPRQVLGARMGLHAADLLRLEVPRRDKRLLVIVETDGCAVDGLSAATGCTVGQRTLRVEDYGKVAATFVDIHTGQALRLAPVLGVRGMVSAYMPGEPRRYFAQLQAYQIMPADELFTAQTVILKTPVTRIMSKPGRRVNCNVCGEEIINGREILRAGSVICRECAGEGYYQPQTRSPLNKVNSC